jgi:hypothetical protein
MEQLIDRMERPFKKLCSYLSLINKEIREMKATDSENIDLKKTDSE